MVVAVVVAVLVTVILAMGMIVAVVGVAGKGVLKRQGHAVGCVGDRLRPQGEQLLVLLR